MNFSAASWYCLFAMSADAVEKSFSTALSGDRRQMKARAAAWPIWRPFSPQHSASSRRMRAGVRRSMEASW